MDPSISISALSSNTVLRVNGLLRDPCRKYMLPRLVYEERLQYFCLPRTGEFVACDQLRVRYELVGNSGPKREGLNNPGS